MRRLVGVSLPPYERTCNANKRFPTKIWPSEQVKAPWAVIKAFCLVEDHLVEDHLVEDHLAMAVEEEVAEVMAEVVIHHHPAPPPAVHLVAVHLAVVHLAVVLAVRVAVVVAWIKMEITSSNGFAG